MTDKLITTEQVIEWFTYAWPGGRDHISNGPFSWDSMGEAIRSRLAEYDALGADNARLKAEVGRLKKELKDWNVQNEFLAELDRTVNRERRRAEKAEAELVVPDGQGGRMKRIFISGPITPRGKRDDCDHLAVEYIMNCRDMIEASNALMRKGWATYCPALDFLNFLLAGTDLPVKNIFEIDLAWVEVCEAMLMVGKWQSSDGSVGEHRRAVELGEDIYYSIEEVPDERD